MAQEGDKTLPLDVLAQAEVQAYEAARPDGSPIITTAVIRDIELQIHNTAQAIPVLGESA